MLVLIAATCIASLTLMGQDSGAGQQWLRHLVLSVHQPAHYMPQSVIPRIPERLQVRFDPGDHFHLNAAGFEALANTIDLKLFR